MSVFTKRFDALERIEYSPEWGNGTGYYDNAVHGEHAPKLAVGQQVAAYSDNGRRIIITGTPLGNVIVFQRYPDRDNLLSYNASREFDSLHLISSRRLTETEVISIVGNEDAFDTKHNVGYMLQRVAMMAKQDYWKE